MKIAGIVAEYNPFHNGHAYHIERTKDAVTGCGATHIVAVMSGNFVQRGEPAILPKSERVSAALAGGADLVLELPLPWAMASAETFSYGAVSILDSLGCVEVFKLRQRIRGFGFAVKSDRRPRIRPVFRPASPLPRHGDFLSGRAPAHRQRNCGEQNRVAVQGGQQHSGD